MDKKILASLSKARKPREALARITQKTSRVCIVRATVQEGILTLDVWNQHGVLAAREFFDGRTRAVGLPGGEWNRRQLLNQEGIRTLLWATPRDADRVREFFQIPNDVRTESCEELIGLVEHGKRTDKGFTASGAFNAGGLDAESLASATPPEGWEDLMQRNDVGCTHIITAKSAWVYIPLEDRKRRMDECICSACGAKWNEAPGWMMNGSTRECPECLGQFRVVRETSRRIMAYEERASLLCFDRVGRTAVAHGFEVEYTIDFEGKEAFTAIPSNIYAWGPYGNYAYCRYETYAMNHARYYCDKWFAEEKMRDGWATGRRAVVMPPECGALEGTKLANIRIEAYADTFRWVYPVRFATISAKTPALEAMCDAGRWGMVQDVCAGNLRLKEGERKAHRALGISKRMYEILPQDVRASFISAASAAEKDGWQASVEEIELLEAVLRQPGGRRLCRSLGAKKAVTYLQRAARYEKRRNRRTLPKSNKALLFEAAAMWLDYRNMAQRLEVQMDTQDSKYPYDVWQRHERLVEEQNRKRQEEIIQKEAVNAQKFHEMWEKIKWADWSHGEFCVIAAKCTAELVEEGAALHHCVGGYTSEVLEGRVIFFIRRAENPKQPYMTLNLNIKTDNVIQLHGYGNNETPAEREHVMAWVNQWLAEVWLPGKKRRNLKTKAA